MIGLLKHIPNLAIRIAPFIMIRFDMSPEKFQGHSILFKVFSISINARKLSTIRLLSPKFMMT